MAVLDYYVRATDLTAKGTMIIPGPARVHQGGGVICLQAIFTPLATDNDGTLYRLFDNVPAGYVPLWGTIASDAIAGFTSASLGLWLPAGGAVKVNNCFASAFTLAAALTSTSPKTAIDAFSNVTLANAGKSLTLLAGDTITNPVPAYDIGLLANTRGTNTGNIVATMFFYRP